MTEKLFHHRNEDKEKEYLTTYEDSDSNISKVVEAKKQGKGGGKRF